MKFFAYASLLASQLLLAGCIVLPAYRVYFEPNPLDGEPARSQSCGYHRAANDGLSRVVGGVEISVFPRHEKDRNLEISILINRTDHWVDLDVEQVELYINNSAVPVRPMKSEIKSALPYFYKSMRFIFPPEAGPSESISVVMRTGFIVVDGVALQVERFRFNKATKLDIYYGSINC